MLTSLYVQNLVTGVLNLNDSIYPVRSIEQNVALKGEYMDKPSSVGRYGRRMYRDGKTVTLEGDILASTSTELNTRRRALKKVMTSHGYYGASFSSPSSTITSCLLNATFDGVGEAVTLYCDPIGEPEIAISALSPAFAQWQASFFAADPNWYGALDSYTQTTPGAGVLPVAGDLAVLPIITLTGPQTNTSFSGAISFAFNSLTLTAGQILVINYATRSISGSVVNPWAGLSFISWEPVPPGNQNFTWSAATSSAGRQIQITTYPIFQV